MTQNTPGQSATLPPGGLPASTSNLYLLQVTRSDLYQYTLRVLLLEYINEPRFYLQKSLAAHSSPPLRTWKNRNSRNRLSWLARRSFSSFDFSGEKATITEVKRNLQIYLNGVALGRFEVTDQCYRRALLKFYNDFYLDATTKREMEESNRAEDLIIFFSKVANSELGKVNVSNPQEMLYRELDWFIERLILLTPSTATKDFTDKLRDYKENIDLNSSSTRAQRISKYRRHMSLDLNGPDSVVDPSPSSDSQSQSPSFNLNEITHSAYFASLFDIEESTLQSDVMHLSGQVTNLQYCKELLAYQKMVQNGDGPLFPEMFPTRDSFNAWQDFELGEVRSIFEKYEPRISFDNVISEEHSMIPQSPREYYIALMALIFKRECPPDQTSFQLSPDAMFFLTRCARLWRVDFSSTLSSLLYSAFNLASMGREHLNLPLIKNFFSMIHIRVTHTDHLDTALWNDVDQKEWIINIMRTEEECIAYIVDLLGSIFADEKPKFSPILSFYYTNIASDPVVTAFKNINPSYQDKVISRLKKTTFNAAEDRYLSLLALIPRDHTLAIHHLQNLAETLLEDIKMLQRRYTKLLLGEVDIAKICSSMFTFAFAKDLPFMLRHVEKHRRSRIREVVQPADALKLFSEAHELRDIYEKINSNTPFPANLEKLFNKYLIKLSNDIIRKIRKVFATSPKNENWQRINDETPYSNSVPDIFLMTRESIKVIKGFSWRNKQQIAMIQTSILREFSVGITAYCKATLDLIQSDLDEADQEAVSSQNLHDDELYKLSGKLKGQKWRKAWSLQKMKEALHSHSSVEAPPPFKYKPRICTILNDLDAMIMMLNEIDNDIDPEAVVALERNPVISNSRSGKTKAHESVPNQIFTVRVIGAEDIKAYNSDGTSNVSVTIINSAKRQEIGTTKVVSGGSSLTWNEEYEISKKESSPILLTLNVWYHSNSNLQSFRGDELCGKAVLLLDPRDFPSDGMAINKAVDLDTQGKLLLKISLDDQNMDAVHSINKAYRTLIRTRDKVIELIVDKFSPFVSFAFSRSTLRSVCGSDGCTDPLDDIVLSAIEPLFDYLNINLSILASGLTRDLFMMVIMRVWSVVLEIADHLLLPPLSLGKVESLPTRNSLWGSSSTINGYGRPLTEGEVEVVCQWLNYLCVEFFHNKSEGPPLAALKNDYYQSIISIPALYNENAARLKKEVDRLNPYFYQYLKSKFSGTANKKQLCRQLSHLERRQSSMKNRFSTSEAEKALEKVEAVAQSNSLDREVDTLNMILRILIAKGELEFVKSQLGQRNYKKKAMQLGTVVASAAMGNKLITQKKLNDDFLGIR